MTPDRWTLLSRLLDDAAARPPADRAAFLDTACPPDLRADLDAMLEADAEAGVFFDDLGAAFGAEVARVGMELGPWRLVDRIGQGGMGTVYRAERADGTFEQNVAVKVLDSVRPDGVARFEQERQILARLEHPGVARLLDGGATPEGHPYLVMELVRGEPITGYATRHALDVDARLALFVEVCETVQAAHQRLVIHRDLKPSNVFVTDEGRVKLLDFGVARLLDDDDRPLTQTAHRAMTPEYAAPEQVRGEPATTATDVYALGVLLYELLAGTRPFDLPRRLAHEAARIVLEEVPDAPSTAVTRVGERGDPPVPSATRRRLEGDLDQICLKALRKEADRRYGTAEAFARDVGRHLEGLPVDARPDALGYRASRFLRRHRAPLAGAAVVLIGLVGLGVAYTVRLGAERDRAEQLATYVLDLFGAADPWTADALPPDATFADALALAVDRAEADLSGADRLRVLDALRASFTGRADSAELSTARRLHAVALSDFGPTSPEVARATATLAWAVKAEDPETADSLFQRALQISPSGVPRARVENDYGFFLKGSGRSDDAATLLSQAVATFRDDGAASREDLATALEHYADALATVGQHDASQAAIEESLALHRELHGASSVPYGSALANAASAASQRGDDAEATRLNREALEVLGQTLADDNRLVLTVTNNLAAMLDGSPSEQLALYHRVRRIRESGGEGDADMTNVVQNIGAAHLRAGRLDSASIWTARARAAYLASPGRESFQASLPLVTLVRVRLGQGRPADAQRLAEQAVAELSDRIGAEHWITRYTDGLAGVAEAEQGREAQGTVRIRRALTALGDEPSRRERADELRSAARRLGLSVE